ncbi:hypothetical protein DFH08DRAFT_979213 [Mycena albidolilacea]|uniref:Uncharacterized protein n=1 Tax=Mycena albidolilacea TaxID=1033008 RepID=A0AAD6YX35_9AGAR|nr:hypothetical protein DFH08DRAFT_979213 [Mycena albidolilacea]
MRRTPLLCLTFLTGSGLLTLLNAGLVNYRADAGRDIISEPCVACVSQAERTSTQVSSTPMSPGQPALENSIPLADDNAASRTVLPTSSAERQFTSQYVTLPGAGFRNRASAPASAPYSTTNQFAPINPFATTPTAIQPASSDIPSQSISSSEIGSVEYLFRDIHTCEQPVPYYCPTHDFHYGHS